MLDKNSLLLKAPHLISEWHPTKNIQSLDTVTIGSNKKVWWICKKGHEWIAAIGNRYRGTCCPFCTGRKLSFEHNLAIKAPHLIAEWHPDKNLPLTPYDVTPRGKKKVWWLCKVGHSWRATLGNRYMGTGCPYCEGRRLSSEHNLAVEYPHLIKEWHPTKNTLSPDEVTPGSGKKVWWLCAHNHEWCAVICARTGGNTCPYCSGLKASITNNLIAMNPQLAKEWDYEKNKLLPTDVTVGSSIKIWWKCRWKHSWQASVCTRTKGHGCPKCNFRSSKLEVRIYCELKYIFSEVLWQSKIEKREIDIFIPAYKLAIEVDGWYWHKSDERINADIRKNQILEKQGINLIRVTDNRASTKIGHNILHYKKDEPEHNVIVRILKKLQEILNILPAHLEKINYYFLTNEYKNKEEYNSIMCALPGPSIENSIAKNKILILEWDFKKNVLPPEQFSSGSRQKVWWVCKNNHEWEATIGSRTAGRNCPFCSGKRSSSDNNLAVKNPILATEWHPTKNVPLMPSEILPNSNKKVWWICKYSHEWEASVDNRSHGTGCPDCSGKKLSKHHNLAIKYPHLINQWDFSKNYPLTPDQVTPKSFLKVWWICEIGHNWKTTIEKRTRGNGCHICTGQIHLIEQY